MEESILLDVVLPLSLIIIMIGLGMSLQVKDFKRVLVDPKAIGIGLANQILLLPAIAVGLVLLFELSPLWAVGFMLIAACPGGPTSNLITFVSRGDTALSISLTAFSSLITVITIPLILFLAIDLSGAAPMIFGTGAEDIEIVYFGSAGDEAIQAPVLDIIIQVVAVTAVPVSIGLLIRRFRPDFADRMDKPARIASAAIFIFVLATIIIDQRSVLAEHFLSLSASTAALNVATMVVGFLTARMVALDMRQSITVSIESGIQNGTLAIVIAMSILGAPEVAIPPGVYSILMFVTGGALMFFFGLMRDPASFNKRA